MWKWSFRYAALKSTIFHSVISFLKSGWPSNPGSCFVPIHFAPRKKGGRQVGMAPYRPPFFSQTATPLESRSRKTWTRVHGAARFTLDPQSKGNAKPLKYKLMRKSKCLYCQVRAWWRSMAKKESFHPGSPFHILAKTCLLHDRLESLSSGPGQSQIVPPESFASRSIGWME